MEKEFPVQIKTPLTSVQSAIFHHQCRNGNSAFYNVGGYIDLDNLNIERLRVAHARLVETFEVFRLRIDVDEGGVFQLCVPPEDGTLRQLDFSGAECPMDAASEWLTELFATALPMERNPLYRAALLKLSESRYLYVGMAHHVAVDGIGFVNWAAALSKFYEDPQGQWLSHWPDLSNVDIVARDRDYMAGDRRAKDLAYWEAKLPRFNDFLLPRRSFGQDPGARVDSLREIVHVSPAMHSKLEALARIVGAERHQVVLGLLVVYIGLVYSGASVVVATPLHGRHSEAERCKIGLLTQMLPLLVGLDASMSFAGVLEGARRAQRELLRHRRLPVSDIVNHPEMRRSRDELFDVGYSYLPAGEGPMFDGRPAPLTYCSHNQEQIPLLLTYWDAGSEGGSQLLFDHNLAYFSTTDVRELVARLFCMLDQITCDPERAIATLSCLTAVEREHLIGSGGAVQLDSGARFELTERLAGEVSRVPSAIALEGAFGRIDYATLDLRVVAVARRLFARYGVAQGHRVGIYLHRSPELIVTLLALVRLGAIYVPIDPQSPLERTQHILRDCGARVVVTSIRVTESLDSDDDSGYCVVDIDDLEGGASRDEHLILASHVKAGAPLYVLYTSGSTGVPKGVLVSRDAVENLLGGLCERLDLARCDRWLFMSSVAFDISIVEWLGCLALGRTCVLPSDSELSDPFALAGFLNTSDIAFIQGTPSRLKQLREAGWIPLEGQVVVSAGEALTADLADDLLARQVVLWNGYGPTEASVYSLVKRVYVDEPTMLRTAIGDELPGYRHYVVHAQLGLVPPGVPGELVIAGEGLAIEYLNLPQLTEERFVRDGYLPEARFYRTGDIVRWLGDGNFQYLGRNDDQIKLRGYRIELNEIRSVLLAWEAVRAAAVVHRKAEGSQPAQLIAYVCLSSSSGAETAARIQAELARTLPSYMVPTAVIVLDELPINANGKLDKQRLPDVPSHQDHHHLAPPETATERLVATLWAALLSIPVERIGRQGDFFALGGDSVLAVKAVVRLRDLTRRKVQISDVFRHSRLAGLAERLNALPPWHTKATLPIVAREAVDFPTSLMQQQMWHLTNQSPGAGRYSMPVAWRITGPVEASHIEAALNEVVRRHEALRTIYRGAGRGLRQVVLADAPFRLVRIDGSSWSNDERDVMLTRTIWRHARHAFDLASELPLLGELVTLGTDESVLLLNLHHIAGDGKSIQLLLAEFLAFHDALVRGEQPVLPEPVRHYVDFATWQQDALERGLWDNQLAWWQRVLADAPHTHELPLDRPRPKWLGGSAVSVECVLPRVLVERLVDLARRLAVTEFSLLQSVFALMLCRWSYCDEVVIGGPVSGRLVAELEGSVGVFVNLLAYVHAFRSEETFSDYLSRFQQQAAMALENQEMPFDRLVETLRLQRDPGCHPVFQLLFAFQDDVPDRMDTGGLHLERLPNSHATTEFDLELLVTRRDGDWTCRWIAAEELFDTDTVSSMAASYLRLLERVVVAPDTEVGRLGLESTLRLSAAPVSTVPDGIVAAHQLVERQVVARGDEVAVRFGGESLTYRALNERANRLARVLAACGVASGSRVALYLPRGIDLIVATLGVLKAGCAYVPVDPAYPMARQEYLLADSEPAAVLSTKTLASSITMFDGQFLVACLDEPEFLQAMSMASAADIAVAEVGLSGENAAYVVYTSGSTGRPKGVVIPHRGLCNLAIAQSRAFGIGPESTVLQFASFSFDAATSEWVTALASGGVLVMVPEDIVLDLGSLTAWATEYGVTHATLPPVVLRRLQPSEWPSLACVISAGEAISLDEARRWAAHCRFINAYGPSESTVCATIGGIHEASSRVVIGKALEGLRLYVVDKGLCPVTSGAIGELCIAGIGLALGYLGREDLTRDRFVSLEGEGGEAVTVYRTGDRVHALPDGNLVFAGRLDEQVKIRGHRVECAEVEACIAGHACVSEVAVRTRKTTVGDTVLVAYVVATNEDDVGGVADVLRRHLAAELPTWMIPAFIVTIDALPLTHNGKLDVGRLEALGVVGADSRSERDLTQTEVAIKAIWDELLDTSVDDPNLGFFEAGGHSLLISDVLARMAQTLGTRLSYRQFFEKATIAGLATAVQAHRSAGATATAPMALLAPPADGVWPLSFEQQRIWFVDQMEQGSNQYNMPVALALEGDIAPDLIETALRRIVERHESLRTTFAVDDVGAPMQVVGYGARFHMKRLALDGLGPDERIRQGMAVERTRPFDLASDLMLRAGLLSLSQSNAVLFLTLHHIAADGWSVDNLIAEFGQTYKDLLSGRAGRLAPFVCQYKELALAQRRAAGVGALSEGIAFWKRYLDGAPQRHSLPLDFERDSERTKRGQAWNTTISEGTTQRLKALSRAHDTSLFLTMQTAFSVLLARWSESHDVLIGTPVANRHRPEATGLIGFFANTLVLRTDCRENVSFRELLRRARDGFSVVFEHQHVPFDVLVDELADGRDAAHTPLVQVLFSLQEDPAAKLAKLDVPSLSFRVLDEDGERPVKFELEVMLSERDGGLACQWLYDTSLFRQETISRLFDSYLALLDAIAADPDGGIHEVDIIGATERRVLMMAPQPLPGCIAKGGSLGERFAHTVARRSDAVAVIHGSSRLTYAELDECSSRLANWLLSKGFGKSKPVALYMKRGIDLVGAVLAIVKSGAPYLPLDLGYPAQRVGHILTDSGATLLLSDNASVALLGMHAEAVMTRCMDDEAFVAERQAQPAAAPRSPSVDGHVYLVYTSGSTGKPKGVMVRHAGFLNLMSWYLHDYAFGEDDRCLLVGSIGFDMTQKNLFAPLVSGGILVIPDEYFDPTAIAALVASESVTVINCVPSAAYQIVEDPSHWPMLSSLRLLGLGGEAIRIAQLRAWLVSPHCHARLLNMYGPSECTDIAIATVEEASAAAAYAVTLPIGRPIYGCTAYVLNDRFRLQPRGVIGELYIGGAGVSDGYVSLPELNARCFLDKALPGAGRLYRTGDLARIGPDGSFHYMGRADHQVKIRGYRVETDEIDTIISESPWVQQAMTVVDEAPNGERRIISFIVLTDDAKTDKDSVFPRIRGLLLASLPAYMVPVRFITLDAMPLTPNGKVDKRALAGLADLPGWSFARTIREPSSDTEVRMLAIWQELLQRDDIGVDEDFFELGGHSLLVTRLVSRVTRDFELQGTSVSVKEFFHHPTIEAAARLIGAKRRYGELRSREAALLDSGNGIAEGTF